jgi:hypothetical protein
VGGNGKAGGFVQALLSPRAATQANCDIQVVIDHYACVEYLTKYAAKGITYIETGIQFYCAKC